MYSLKMATSSFTPDLEKVWHKVFLNLIWFVLKSMQEEENRKI